LAAELGGEKLIARREISFFNKCLIFANPTH
jgi:CO dehydrogenase/acetyl-CoA synthase gamma subunit (corrinoid Fe-S protein)